MFSANEMHVVYASDDNYAPIMGISILSLLRHNRSADKLTVYVLDSGIGEENRVKLQQLAEEYGRSIRLIPIQKQLASLDLHMGPRKIAITSYARLFMCSLIPEECDRVLYLDCDMIINDDLLPLWNTELGDALVAGVQDTVDNYYYGAIDLPRGIRYVNAGMLLINLKSWREEKLEPVFMDYIREKGGNVQHHDQGVINHTCGSRRVIVPIRYNMTANSFSFSVRQSRRMFDMSGTEYYGQDEVDEARRSPAVIHYTAGVLGRPWETGCVHPLKDRFVGAMQASPWKDLPLKPNGQPFLTRAASFVSNHISTDLFVFIFRLMSKRYYR